MSLSAIFNIAGSALTAETARLTTSAENMSNANVESGNASEVYKAKYPIFKAVQEHANQWMGEQISGGVQLKGTYESTMDPIKRYAPDNPLADKQGFVYTPNVNYVEEMANVISASRSYQMDVELLNTTKQLMQRTLKLGE
ncbi:flagellar basal body rod protein FlgC [Legionella sp. 227]|uniref:flagellar basal body rod protein FlgC n=1 Tax=Legionella sp. 227 TaxID=3367288 RepID=UPI00370D2476